MKLMLWFSQTPWLATAGSSPHLAVTCHSAAADCIGLKPSQQFLFNAAVALPLGGNSSG